VKITCRLRSRNSATQGKEGAIVRHKDGPFNQTNHIFIASRLRDLEVFYIRKIFLFYF